MCAHGAVRKELGDYLAYDILFTYNNIAYKFNFSLTKILLTDFWYQY